MKYEMLIESSEQIHALSHPLRQRILSILSSKELTNKQISEVLGETAPKVHFHVKELLNAGIIQQTREEVRGSIVEKKYSASARSFRLSPSLELSKVDEHKLYESTFHEAYRNLIESIDYYEGILSNSQIFQQQVWLTEEERISINKHLSAINDILNMSQMKKQPSTETLSLFSLSYFFHPTSPNSHSGGKLKDKS
ncbi:ArsR/SmtB family transcription factor [Bacillus mycoides]|uniref:ArsR/SmtB family transcription factor n=1 Tax=Bacillus mycoides TaxID=1405 RepID=UPI0010BE71E8|nr:winged helix-turn-helix domain-containing protein [Bacillus mycoides]TKI33561.1 winged helix-turn-helix transcriptional regulator [Bacillus mycoides]